jgi:uncharacterized membrane protein
LSDQALFRSHQFPEIGEISQRADFAESFAASKKCSYTIYFEFFFAQMVVVVVVVFVVVVFVVVVAAADAAAAKKSKSSSQVS